MMLLFVLFPFILAIGAQNLSSIPELDDALNIGGVENLKLQPYLEPSTSRHVEEKTRLLESLDHGVGEWGSSHPRYALLQALHSLSSYKEKHFVDLDAWKEAYDGISDEQKGVINSVTSHVERFEKFRENQQKNLIVVQEILENALEYYKINTTELKAFATSEEEAGNFPYPYQVSDILNHFVRDWSVGGPHKRDLGSEPILESLSALFPDRKTSSAQPKRILLPGAGLGRLAHEIAQLGGFEVTMNEISAYMNVVYRYAETFQYSEMGTFRPFLDWWSYQPSMEELALEVRYPDVAINASDVLLVEGDFNIVFAHATGQFDVVVTLFFIDTAQNMLDYLDTIHAVLKPGGLWINLGSFLYGASPFLHLSIQDFANVGRKMGFRFLDIDERWGELSVPEEKIRTRDVSYLFNERAYRKKLYEAHFWIMEKS